VAKRLMKAAALSISCCLPSQRSVFRALANTSPRSLDAKKMKNIMPFQH
jgi:hypothetical protein